jgi:membrane-bound inhibitor of C-type lysozyme
MKKLPVFFIVFVVLVVIYFWVNKLNIFSNNTPSQKKTAVELTCDDGASMTATYYDQNKEGVMMRLSLSVFKDGDTAVYDLYPSISGSGARFETKDQKHSLWEHQGTFTFAVDGVDTSVCQEKQAQ